jgi:YVTN family beta-propeller protein
MTAASNLLALLCIAVAQQPARPPVAETPQVPSTKQYAGPTQDGFLLPNGWKLTPAGEQLPLSDLPLNILPLKNEPRVVVTTNGFNTHAIQIVDLATKQIVGRQTSWESWFGLAADESTLNHTRLWWSGGGGDRIHELLWNGDKLAWVTASDNSPTARARQKLANKANPHAFKSGLTLHRADGGLALVSLDVDAGTITALPTDGSKVKPVTSKIGGRPYDVVSALDGQSLFVSDWGGRRLIRVGAADIKTMATIPVGEHPNQIAVHPRDGRVFVACASSNGVWVVDPATNAISEVIYTALFPNSPEGSTPDALALAPDGKTLFVANADNNCVAVVDVSTPKQAQVKGFIPTGWYPTAVAVTKDGKTLLVGVGKGNQTRANPITNKDREADAPAKFRRRAWAYIGTTLSGALSFVPMPDDKKLAEYTAQVYRNCPYSDKLLTAAPSPEPTVIPTKVGELCPIEHVIYVIKENRTYDQVFGDLPQGNGDPTLTMFGRTVTPNHHKLAEEFVLLDNTYCNGQVSRDGHPWSTQAYNTDYVARDWMLTYSQRAGVDEDDELHVGPSGYIWDAAKRAGKTYRNYGEYGKRVSDADGKFRMEGRTESLVGHVCPNFKVDAKGRELRDPENVEVFLKEFFEFEAKGMIPNLMVVSLGEDHTKGTRTGAPTPQACVASNDLALGRLVEAVSKSKSWAKTAIFVIEDDAQNGPDHVDAHRTVALVISPYCKRKHVDSTQYSTSSVLRTIELILGLKPLSQYDAAARPMFGCFTNKLDLTPYTHLPAQIDLNAKNDALAYGAERSNKMDWSEFDRIDDFALNEILWRAIKGKDAPTPPAVRRAIAKRQFTN